MNKTTITLSIVAILATAACATEVHRKGATPLFAPKPGMRLLQAGRESFVDEGPDEYIYSLEIHASTPLETSWDADTPDIDHCVEWMEGSNGVNFTWYGFQIQLPIGAETKSGYYHHDVTQPYNVTSPGDSILSYNLSTSEAEPAILINFNDHLFWEGYNFDFASSDSVISEDGNYQEFKTELAGAVTCYVTPANETFRTILFPVTPTLTISMTRLAGPSPSPGPVSNGVALNGHIFGIASFIASIGGLWMWL
ncbi:hypothetical protein HJC23_003361 [Cyclotella cryptica]|uniref:Uncharacterized protein n=1 Tax=Cyclotella cryptica TaxID=29204 RepID=A0ABD3QY51_9STRA|eukprot:CCRYP_000945-RA/>CCRYP_000945-RA protein AED:0.00 eAED:0.00 QI:424/-1/1/1/-1/1/1/317/252